VIDEKENLKSTMEHRLWTYGCLSILGASIAGAAADIHSPGDAATVLGAVFAAYVLSDLGTAVYHWAVDNYGDGNTPVFGRQIAAFQGHHQRPWTITQREFCNNVHQVRTGEFLMPVSKMLMKQLGWRYRPQQLQSCRACSAVAEITARAVRTAAMVLCLTSRRPSATHACSSVSRRAIRLIVTLNASDVCSQSRCLPPRLPLHTAGLHTTGLHTAGQQVFQPAMAPAAAIFALGPFVPLGAHAFMPSFLLLVCMSQQFHAWSHMKKSELPEVVVALQVGLPGRCFCDVLCVTWWSGFLLADHTRHMHQGG
jgi:hypothetical protein